jgi:hypothetical protein
MLNWYVPKRDERRITVQTLTVIRVVTGDYGGQGSSNMGEKYEYSFQAEAFWKHQ